MAAVTDPWITEAIDLRKQGLSERAIADAVGKAASTVHTALATAKAAGLLDDAPARGESAPSSNGNGADAETDAIQADIERVADEEGKRVWAEDDRNLDPERLARIAESGEVPGQTDLSDFIAEAGEAVGPMPKREMDQGETVYVEEIRVDGSTQFAIDFGGKMAQTATLALSGKATVDGFYRKGDRIRGSFEAVIVGVSGRDSVDKQTGIVTEATQAHSAKLTDLRVS